MPHRPDDIVITSSLRTPIGRAKRGSFKDTPLETLLAPVMSAVIKESKIDAGMIGDVVIGVVLPRSSQSATEVRIAGFLANIPEHVPVHTVNRQCSSGLQAIASVAAAIQAGYYEIGLAGGVECMSLNPMTFEGEINAAAEHNNSIRGCYMTMGQTSENVAAKYNISREQQDALALRSHQLAGEAQKSGRFAEEIVAVKTKITDPKTGASKEITVTQDEGIRVETTLQSLGKLKPAFSEDGSTTAGNSSQVSDGAAAAIVMKRETAQKLGAPIWGILRSFVSVGCDPSIMGIGPAVAIPAAVKKAGLKLSDIGLFEINEAFASQATYCVNHLKLDMNKVNVNGGAIALGHPLGCTGARATATLLHEMRRRKVKYGIVSMCIGSGMGAAAVYENNDV